MRHPISNCFQIARRSIRHIAAGTLLFASDTSFSHDVWLEINGIAGGSNSQPSVSQLFGETYPISEVVAMDARLVTRLDVLTDADRLDLLPKTRRHHGNMALPLSTDDDVIVAPVLVALDHGFIEHRMGGEEFHEYLAHEHFHGIHHPHDDEDQPEIYARSMKTYAHGSRISRTQLFRQRIGQRLEIVLCNDPARLSPGSVVELRLFFEDEPLSNHRVSALPPEHSASGQGRQDTRTDPEGYARFAISRPGQWLLRSVYLEPCREARLCQDVAWQSHWTAFTFRVTNRASEPPEKPEAVSSER